MQWDIRLTSKLCKQVKLLDEDAFFALQLLLSDLKNKGPIPGNSWSHYGKLSGKKREDKRHCHILKGRPTYVCCWEVFKFKKLIKVYYVGTHENAPY